MNLKLLIVFQEHFAVNVLQHAFDKQLSHIVSDHFFFLFLGKKQITA